MRLNKRLTALQTVKSNHWKKLSSQKNKKSSNSPSSQTRSFHHGPAFKAATRNIEVLTLTTKKFQKPAQASAMSSTSRAPRCTRQSSRSSKEMSESIFEFNNSLNFTLSRSKIALRNSRSNSQKSRSQSKRRIKGWPCRLGT